MGILFYRPPQTITLTENFEYNGGWSGTVNFSSVNFANPIASTPLESFEYSENWSGTVNFSSVNFDSPLATIIEDFNTTEGW